MTKIELLGNKNYAITVIAVGEPHDLQGLDNLVGVSIYGLQALTTRGIEAGDLRLLFVIEAQIGERFAHENDLNRKAESNKTEATGFLEQNRRVRAIKLRGHVSNALLMPLDSLAYTGLDTSSLKVGDTFDTVNGETVVRKYEVPGKGVQGKPGQPKIRQRVDQKLFPMHLDTEHLFRNMQVFRAPRRVVVTQKLHGTSIRIGRVPAARDKGWIERVVVNKWLGISTPETAYEDVAGSRRAIKGRDDNNHYYDSDIWAEYAKRLEGMIPENFIVYGELIGWESPEKPIMHGYTYDLKPGERELYVYRVATVNGQGVIADLSWEGVEQFCAAIGVKTVPTLDIQTIYSPMGLDDDQYLYEFTELLDVNYSTVGYPDAVPLSNPKSVDEGFCLRIEGQVPRIYKAKSPLFFEHETKLLDKGEVDLESVA